jgi:hypothetical protein
MEAASGPAGAATIDATMVVSNSPDMLVAMSGRLETVVGCGAETVSGSYWLTAAQDGGLQRFIFVQHAGMTRGMAMGDPLPSEAQHPIEDLDGRGLLAAMATLGLRARRWLDAGPAAVVDYDGARFPEDGPIEQVRSTYHERYKRPEDEWLSEIVAVVREQQARAAAMTAFRVFPPAWATSTRTRRSAAEGHSPRCSRTSSTPTFPRSPTPRWRRRTGLARRYWSSG